MAIAMIMLVQLDKDEIETHYDDVVEDFDEKNTILASTRFIIMLVMLTMIHSYHQ